MTLTEFLTARIDEDEAVAAAEAVLRDGAYFENEASAFERRFDPDRVLAECEANRVIIARLTPIFEDDEQAAWDLAVKVLLDLAAIYADHPDYDDLIAEAEAVNVNLMIDANNPDDTADYGGSKDSNGRGPEVTYCLRCRRLAIDHTPGKYSIYGVCPASPMIAEILEEHR